MSANCCNCNSSTIFKEPKKTSETFRCPCDHCKRVVCQTCSEISATEIRAILLTKRIIPFYCKDCMSKVRQLLGLMDRVVKVEDSLNDVNRTLVELPGHIEELKRVGDLARSLEARMVEFSGKLGQIENSAGTTAAVQSDGVNNNAILSEFHNRQERMNNFMLYNVPEGNNDVDEVNSIISTLSESIPRIVSVTRVGKKNINGRRSIKVALVSASAVQALFKQRFKLKGKEIYLGYDLTRQQRDAEKLIRAELKSRIDAGENNLIFKYVDGQPKIQKRKN